MISLKNYTLKYLAVVLLLVIGVWAGIFYAIMLEELYDNTDDGLKNLKIQIIREAYIDEKILDIKEFDFNQYKITSINPSEYKEGNFFRNELFYMEYDHEMEPYRVLETYFIDKSGNHQKLEIRTSTVEEDDYKESLFLALVFLYFLIVISIVFVNNKVLKQVWKPFYTTLKNLEEYEFGKESRPKNDPTKVREFNLLNYKIDQMIERNERSFTLQKQFIENASHELQTPLAIAVNKLDLLIENDEFTENSIKQLSETKEGLMRLVQLNKSLLMLSRIDNNQFNIKEEVTFNEIIKSILEDFSDLLSYKNISVEVQDNGTFSTYINPDLAYILVSNLFRNAVKFNISNGKILILISEKHFTIQNTSAENNSLDSELIFNRFYKKNQDNTSTGLGLSIVKTIVDNHSVLNINYTFENNFHIFSINNLNS